jgi:hypothetical protein
VWTVDSLVLLALVSVIRVPMEWIEGSKQTYHAVVWFTYILWLASDCTVLPNRVGEGFLEGISGLH